MFTKETFIDYFQQILTLEKEMEKGYLHILGSITHPDYFCMFYLAA
jgi:hypothetical protein